LTAVGCWQYVHEYSMLGNERTFKYILFLFDCWQNLKIITKFSFGAFIVN
jgi:hypothetical protein